MFILDVKEICTGEAVKIVCGHSELIMMTSAEYGRKQVGRCLRKADDFMGCTNDVLPLLDRWCSGRSECTLSVPTEELENANTACLDILKMYLRITYTCLEGYYFLHSIKLDYEF